MKRDAIPDFHAVRSDHMGIHDRLCNWSRYVSSGRGRSSTMPMFRFYRSTDTWTEADPRMPIDTLDGSRIEREVAKLPEKHMGAVRWSYVYSLWGVSVFRACRVLAVNQTTLSQLVHDGRAMLKNRSA